MNIPIGDLTFEDTGQNVLVDILHGVDVISAVEESDLLTGEVSDDFSKGSQQVIIFGRVDVSVADKDFYDWVSYALFEGVT